MKGKLCSQCPENHLVPSRSQDFHEPLCEVEIETMTIETASKARLFNYVSTCIIPLTQFSL